MSEIDELKQKIIELEAEVAELSELLRGSVDREQTFATRATKAEAERDDWKREWERRAHMLDKCEAKRDRLKAALTEIAGQDTLTEGEAKWHAERDGEEWSPDVDTAYNTIIDRARAVLSAPSEE